MNQLCTSRAAAVLMIGLTLLLSGCDWLGKEKRTWSEDVLLDDGTTVQVRRHAEFTEHNSWSGDAYGTVDTAATLEILMPGTRVPTWSVPLLPMVLYRDAGEWVLVAKTSDCGTWSARGRTLPPYWEFRLRGGSWIETPLSEKSIGQRTNLFFDFLKEVPKHVTVADTARLRDSSSTHPLYRSIDSDPTIFNCS